MCMLPSIPIRPPADPPRPAGDQPLPSHGHIDAAADQDFAKDDVLNCGRCRPDAEPLVGPRPLRSPKEPTAAYIELHTLTHLPFQSWCPHCVASKKHKSRQDTESTINQTCPWFLPTTDSLGKRAGRWHVSRGVRAPLRRLRCNCCGCRRGPHVLRFVK